VRRSEAAERGKAVSRRVSQIEYLADLPMGLGPGISVRFTSSYQTGESHGQKILLAKDRDDHWRPVRVDKE
jgi:hypothetical protein